MFYFISNVNDNAQLLDLFYHENMTKESMIKNILKI